MSDRWQPILRRTEAYYAARAEKHGATHRGVDWNSPESQEVRFDQLLRLTAGESEPLSLLDYGCGYGALADHLARRGLTADYQGFDISPTMIELARQRHARRGWCRFATSLDRLEPAEWAVASGVLNVKQQTPPEEWEDWVCHCLDQLDAFGRRGFAFNVLSLESDAEHRRPHLYYADPEAMLAACRRRYSPRVELVSDYGLYEFTVLVRRSSRAEER